MLEIVYPLSENISGNISMAERKQVTKPLVHFFSFLAPCFGYMNI